ncbi:MAG: sigma-70 family RNA polymerase sigma factor [Bacteroidia bacterium]|nr:sigma-70 family RNA polymerase sigma factor [Bacteroidia bacterium]
MGPYSDSKIIDGIIKKRREVIHFMYRDYFPLILALIEKNSGNYQDAEDIFQDGLVALYLRCRDKELVLNCALRSYFYSICRNLWLQRLERKHRLVFQSDLMVNDCAEKYVGKENLTREQKLARHRVFWKHFKGLPYDCQQVLLMYMEKIPFKEVAEKLGFTDENYAKVRKYLCKKLLRKRVKQDPEYPNCIDHE